MKPGARASEGEYLWGRALALAGGPAVVRRALEELPGGWLIAGCYLDLVPLPLLCARAGISLRVLRLRRNRILRALVNHLDNGGHIGSKSDHM